MQDSCSNSSGPCLSLEKPLHEQNKRSAVAFKSCQLGAMSRLGCNVGGGKCKVWHFPQIRVLPVRIRTAGELELRDILSQTHSLNSVSAGRHEHMFGRIA